MIRTCNDKAKAIHFTQQECMVTHRVTVCYLPVGKSVVYCEDICPRSQKLYEVDTCL